MNRQVFHMLQNIFIDGLITDRSVMAILPNPAELVVHPSGPGLHVPPLPQPPYLHEPCCLASLTSYSEKAEEFSRFRVRGSGGESLVAMARQRRVSRPEPHSLTVPKSCSLRSEVKGTRVPPSTRIQQQRSKTLSGAPCGSQREGRKDVQRVREMSRALI